MSANQPVYATLLLGALSVASGRLLAQTPGAAISYSSSAECPDERQFHDQLALHLRSGAVPSSQPIVVEAQQLEAHSIARVRFVDENGALAVRELFAPTCAEVVTAAALVVALAIDSRRQRDTAPVATAPEQRRQDAWNAPPTIDQRPARWEAPASFGFQFGAGALAHMAVAPDPMLGVVAFAGLGARPSWDLRGLFVYATTAEVTRDARVAKFSLLAGRLDGCALPLATGGRFALHPCLAVELGAVRSAGIATERYTSSEQTTFWMGAGPLLRGQATFDSLGLESYAGPWFPIVGPDSFVTGSDEGERSFHEVPPVGLLAGLNLSVAID